jgi:L-asparagine transporter-like permease
MQADDLITRERGLKRSLTPRQLTMIGLGGALGTGLFTGSGIAISCAGPGVLLSYVVAACIALAVTYSLSEMAVAHPAAGSFGLYADLHLSPPVRRRTWVMLVSGCHLVVRARRLCHEVGTGAGIVTKVSE